MLQPVGCGDNFDGLAHCQIRNALRIRLKVPGQRHIILRRALGHLAVLLKPPQPLTVRNLILGLGQQAAGLNGMFASLPHGSCCRLVFGLNAGGEVTQLAGVKR